MAKNLKTYNKKRDFEKTDEPQGKNEASHGRLRFVIQHHMARREHYDFRLEWDGVMLSWAVPKGPSFLPSDKRLAVHVEDHPLEYRHFEGTIPKGEYGGGTVMIWDEGHYEPYSDMADGLKKGSLKFILNGKRLKGRWALVRLKADENEEKEQNNWLLIKDKDEYALTEAGIKKYTTSIRTGRAMAEIEAEASPKKFIPNPFETAAAQLAKLVNQVPAGEEWLYEFKYDGYRIISYLENNQARLLTRNGIDYADRFASIADSLISFAAGRSMVLDGEMVITDENGRPDFQALQNYLKKPGGKNLTYIAFDLLALDGIDFRTQPLIRRKEELENLLKNAPENIHYSRHVKGTSGTVGGEESLAIAIKLKMEGIIGKKADSVYSGSRTSDWIKIKCDWRQEFVIGGYTISEKSVRGLSSLLLGYYENDKLIYAGRAGTGFTEQSAKELIAKFNSLTRKTAPFSNAPKMRTDEDIVWLRPTLVAEIKFAEWTKEKQLRQASFKGIRVDKEAMDVRREVAGLLLKPKNAKATTNTKELEKNAKTATNAKESEKNAKAKTNAKKSEKNAKAKSNAKELEKNAKTAANAKELEKNAKITSNSKESKASSEKRLKEFHSFNQRFELRSKSPDFERSMDINISIQNIRISNPDKVIFEDPEITKIDVVRYYEQVAEKMLPYIKGRILSIVRCPKGVEGGACFYKKHPEPGRQGIITIAVPSEKDKERDDYFYINDITGLISEAQMGTLEFHTWGSQALNLENPDLVVFDLDPDEGMDLKTVRQGVRDLREILTELSLNAYLKTSGGKGYHVVVPVKPSVSWEKIKEFAKSVVKVMENKWPERYTSNSRKAKRPGKIYVDWQRNGRGATSIAPYSLRARSGAAVSMPIAWDELAKVAPDSIDMKKALKRIKNKDPWADFFENMQQLK
ncbi:MAG: non-homologous end-joining DNA ligase [Lachnospiraceae bacterium]|nr:non-homologous end-joining DNA ligase [Lachnospiraceae bacterium]